MSNDHDRRGDDQSITHRVREHGSLWTLITDAILAYRERTQILQQQSIELSMISNRLEIIHRLVFELTTRLIADPEKAKELSERIRKQVEALKSATPKLE